MFRAYIFSNLRFPLLPPLFLFSHDGFICSGPSVAHITVFLSFDMTVVFKEWKQDAKAITFSDRLPCSHSRCVQPLREEACSSPSQMPVRRWWSWVWPSLRCVTASRASYCTTLTESKLHTATKLLHSVSQT